MRVQIGTVRFRDPNRLRCAFVIGVDRERYGIVGDHSAKSRTVLFVLKFFSAYLATERGVDLLYLYRERGVNETPVRGCRLTNATEREKKVFVVHGRVIVLKGKRVACLSARCVVGDGAFAARTTVIGFDRILVRAVAVGKTRRVVDGGMVDKCFGGGNGGEFCVLLEYGRGFGDVLERCARFSAERKGYVDRKLRFVEIRTVLVYGEGGDVFTVRVIHCIVAGKPRTYIAWFYLIGKRFRPVSGKSRIFEPVIFERYGRGIRTARQNARTGANCYERK